MPPFWLVYPFSQFLLLKGQTITISSQKSQDNFKEVVDMKFMEEKFTFNTPEEIISDIQQGKIVIITDDESRENEGDFVFAAQFVDSDKINFLAKHGRGLICVPLTEERVTQLGIQDMVGKYGPASPNLSVVWRNSLTPQ